MSDDAHDRQMRIVAPATGEAIELADVPDPVFSAGTMGEGLGIRPTTGTVQVLAPVDGTVVMVAGTGHALGFSTPQGLEVLLHLGVDTVELEGKPFDLGVAAGQTVSAGQPLGTMNLDAITEAGKDTTIIFAITNTAQRLSGIDVTTGPVQAGDAIGVIVGKQHAGRTARQRFQPQRAATGESIQHVRARNFPLQPVEQRLAHPVGTGAQPAAVGNHDAPPAMLAADDADFVRSGGKRGFYHGFFS